MPDASIPCATSSASPASPDRPARRRCGVTRGWPRTRCRLGFSHSGRSVRPQAAGALPSLPRSPLRGLHGCESAHGRCGRRGRAGRREAGTATALHAPSCYRQRRVLRRPAQVIKSTRFTTMVRTTDPRIIAFHGTNTRTRRSFPRASSVFDDVSSARPRARRWPASGNARTLPSPPRPIPPDRPARRSLNFWPDRAEPTWALTLPCSSANSSPTRCSTPAVPSPSPPRTSTACSASKFTTQTRTRYPTSGSHRLRTRPDGDSTWSPYSQTDGRLCRPGR